MALRLFLMGVVASLALDLPFGGSDPKSTTQSARSWLDARVIGRDDASRTLVMVAEPTPTESRAIPIPDVRPEPAKPAAIATEPTSPLVTAEAIETKTVEATPAPILPGRAEAAALAAAPESPASSVETKDAVPALMPPASDVADAAPAPAVDEILALDSPITVVMTDPMAPPLPAEAAVTAPIPAPTAELAPAIVAEAPKVVDQDAAFTSIVGGMASSFAADLTTVPAEDSPPLLAKVEPEAVAPPAPAAEEVIAAEEKATVEDLYPGLAFALNREAEGVIPVVVPDPAPARVEAAPVAETAIDPSRAERLAQAVKLTGQAVHAWASLLGQRPSVTTIQR